MWGVRRFHRPSFEAPAEPRADDASKRAWKLTDEGVLVENEDTERRTKGEPTTLTRIVEDFGDAIAEASELTDVPEQLIAAVIATESGGRLVVKRRDEEGNIEEGPAERFEAHLNDWSFGLMQTLTNTAHALALQAPAKLGVEGLKAYRPVPNGGSADEWRELLSNPETSIRLGALYLARSNDRWSLEFDPIFVYATFNAGSPQPPGAVGNEWGIHGAANGKVFDHFAAWYGDACAVYGVC